MPIKKGKFKARLVAEAAQLQFTTVLPVKLYITGQILSLYNLSNPHSDTGPH